jgi:hypothetical protein
MMLWNVLFISNVPFTGLSEFATATLGYPLGLVWMLPFLVLYPVLPFLWGRRAQQWWVAGLAYGLGTGVLYVLVLFETMVRFPDDPYGEGALISTVGLIGVSLTLALAASFAGWWWRERSAPPPRRGLVHFWGAGGRWRPGAVRGISRFAPVAAGALIILLAAGLFFRVGPGAARLDVGAAGSSTRSPGSQTTLEDISMVSPSEGWAVGQSQASIDDGDTRVLLMHLQDGVWSHADVPISGYLNCVSMVSATDGWAGGTMGFLHYNGTTWTVAQTHLNWEPKHIQMLSATDGWAIGLPGALAHYDGHRWTKEPLPAPYTGDAAVDFTGLSMTSASDGWAIANIMMSRADQFSTAVLLHYTDGHWEVGQRIKGANLQSISMVSTGDGWALGGESNAIGRDLYHYNGTWVKVESPIIGYPSKELLMMRSATDGWIAYTPASGGVPELLHYNGTGWSHVSLPLVMDKSTDSFEIDGLAVTGAGDALAVGARISNANNSAPLGAGSYVPTVTPMILRDSAGTWSAIED